MKAVIKENQTKTEKPFPKLMIANDNQIVLFSETGIGVVVYKSGTCPYQIGYHHKFWHMPDFTDFNGTVELSND